MVNIIQLFVIHVHAMLVTNIIQLLEDCFTLKYLFIRMLINWYRTHANLQFIMFRSSIVRFIFCLNSLALKGSVEDADESNEGDEKEPPPKNQENLEELHLLMIEIYH